MSLHVRVLLCVRVFTCSLVFLHNAVDNGDCALDGVVPVLVLLPLCLPNLMTICHNSLLALRVLLPSVPGLREHLLQIEWLGGPTHPHHHGYS